MHKSGTTLLSEWFHNSGIKMIDHYPLPNKLEYSIGTKYERLSFLNLNNYTLGMKGKSSLYIPKKKKKISKEILNAFKLIKDNQYGKWGAKDPRISLLLMEYDQIFPNSQFIFIFRNPQEVAMRYSKRNKLNVIKSLNAWLVYNKAIINFIKKHDVSYTIQEFHVLLNENNVRLNFANKFGLDPKILSNKSEKISSNRISLIYKIIDFLFFKNKIQKTYNELQQKIE